MAGQVELPIFLEDSHAGSFYWIAESIPLDQPHTLVLFDAHSDSSEVFDSDTVRSALREPRNMDELRALTSSWRETGAIQCFNWIEPLMPAPLAEVIWIPPGEISPERRQQLLAEIDREINAHEIVAPRSGEPLTPKFTVASLAELKSKTPRHPVIVSLDLDYFAEGGLDEFDEVWETILNLPDLRAITASISTPYLKSKMQASELVTRFLEESNRITNARVEFDPDASIGPDRSRRARELLRSGKPIPSFDSALIPPTPEIFVSGHSPDADGCIRIKMGDEFRIRPRETAHEIEWVRLEFEHEVYNLMGPDTPFAAGAPWIQRLIPKPISAKRDWIDQSDLTKIPGTIRIRARIDGVASNILKLRLSESTGFRGAIEECFNLPYVLGSSLLAGGPDRAEGGDCANLAIYALRRGQHRPLPWRTPPQFERLCRTIDSFEPGAEDNGIFVSFGSHLGVLWDDQPPLGEFNSDDRFVHQLEGLPEVLTLAELSKNRREPRFLRLRSPEPAVNLVFGGDVMLARTIGERILAEPHFDPFAHVAKELRQADFAIVNLECALTNVEKQVGDRPFVFLAPPAAAEAMTKAGIDAVSLANNHSLDGGEAGLLETRKNLTEAKIAGFGADQILFQEINGVKIAIVGLEPDDSLEIVRKAAAEADFVAVIPHWGVEHSREIQNSQRNFAQQLIEAGADFIAGAGPHVPQKGDQVLSRPVFYSMGNLVFDQAGPTPDWRTGFLVVVSLDEAGEILSVETRDYQIPGGP
ncbi:MAG: hypothetical protein ACI8UO_002768 [Verrucomicrobiales bacterium]|jgi:hypothetical protein